MNVEVLPQCEEGPEKGENGSGADLIMTWEQAVSLGTVLFSEDSHRSSLFSFLTSSFSLFCFSLYMFFLFLISKWPKFVVICSQTELGSRHILVLLF